MRKILFAVLSLSLGTINAQIDTSKKIETVPTVISDTPGFVADTSSMLDG